MVKKETKKPGKLAKPDRWPLIDRELRKRTKADLIAMKLMKAGSYQVECSDEGLMSDDIGECLQPVIQAVKASGGVGAAKWAGDMQKADRVGCICDKELAELRSPS